MLKAVRRHPFVTSFFVLAGLLIVFSFYLFEMGGVHGSALTLGDRVAVVEIEGIIADSRQIVEEIESAKENEHIKAVIFRINSPGGGVAPSQEIYSEIKKLSREKKVVASLSSVAASGGYYVACAAEKIVANPGTLTGSIGVIMNFTNLEGLFEKVGLKNYVVKSGKFKDIGSSAREMTVEEKELLQNVITDVHDQFVAAIVEGRGLPEAEVRAIADGRIFSGAQAMELGLVDKLGTLQDSIQLAADMAGIKGKPKVVYIDKKSGLLDYIFGNSVRSFWGNLSLPRLMYQLII